MQQAGSGSGPKEGHTHWVLCRGYTHTLTGSHTRLHASTNPPFMVTQWGPDACPRN